MAGCTVVQAVVLYGHHCFHLGNRQFWTAVNIEFMNYWSPIFAQAIWSVSKSVVQVLVHAHYYQTDLWGKDSRLKYNTFQSLFDA